jgi:hypothetical protein
MTLQKNILRLTLVGVTLSVAAALPLLSSAQISSLRVVNNSSGLEIRHLYLSPVDGNAWGTDQLGGASISSGGSYTLNSFSCDGPNIKVIAEDQNGCFISSVASCSGDAAWAITDDMTPDCGN